MSPQLPDSMHRQIYQGYISGPYSLFRLFEEAFGRRALDGPPDPDRQQSQIDDLSAQIARLCAQVEKLRAKVSQLRRRHFQLGRRNAELEAFVVKDSHNRPRRPRVHTRGHLPKACLIRYLVDRPALASPACRPTPQHDPHDPHNSASCPLYVCTSPFQLKSHYFKAFCQQHL